MDKEKQKISSDKKIKWKNEAKIVSTSKCSFSTTKKKKRKTRNLFYLMSKFDLALKKWEGNGHR